MCFQDQIGTPLLKRDPNGHARFWLLGIATIVRPASTNLGLPMEFLKVAPYKSWIDSID